MNVLSIDELNNLKYTFYMTTQQMRNNRLPNVSYFVLHY